MNRRQWLGRSAVAGPVGLSAILSKDFGNRAAAAPPSSGKRTPIKITDVKTILTAPARIRLVVVKVLTSEPGLYGLGCATFTQRARAVETAVDKYLRPFLIGKNPLEIEDLWQSNFVSSYWRNGPVLGNAISGVDMALWDILGKRAGLPVYQLFGGKCRKAVDTYRHASGQTFEDVEKAARGLMDKGQRFVRVQVAVPGLVTYGAGCKAGQGRQVAERQCESSGVGAAGLRPHGAQAVRASPQEARRRGGAAARHARTRSADPGDATGQGSRAVQIVLSRRSAQPGGCRLLREASRSRRARRSRWANCSTTPTNGWGWSAIG